jgi:hypothetical protein
VRAARGVGVRTTGTRLGSGALLCFERRLPLAAGAAGTAAVSAGLASLRAANLSWRSLGDGGGAARASSTAVLTTASMNSTAAGDATEVGVSGAHGFAFSEEELEPDDVSEGEAGPSSLSGVHTGGWPQSIHLNLTA